MLDTIFLTEVFLDNVQINFDSEALWLMNIVLALVMFGIALEISVNDFKQLWVKPKPVLVGFFSQFFLLPAITFILVYFLRPYPSVALGMFMVAACPGGNISNYITHLAGGNTALSVCLTAIATLVAIFMTPFNLEFWGGMYPPTAELLNSVAIEPIEMVKLVALLLGVPLILGMLMNHWKPSLSNKLAKVFKIVSLVFFIFLVFLALAKNITVFLDYILYIFWIVLIHNLMAFLGGYSLSKIFRLDSKNTRSITIETGIQNSGLGLLLIFTFFDGLGGMALLAAFWGIWHMVSGLLLASYWNFKPLKGKKLA
ncbi:bile acid:sodium symporter family protein [Maribacter sp. PR1]|uniref:Bile acid:sodium symporter family protein n=1 Tax=Maribacter cobaltidurans TaxID=1178778 RepID=A0ABU7IXN6_9FLAO|nr:MULTISPECIES: bile acid:sodium symporter family protein [Maribacter]MDC6390346.1 bile acid:sodium symporter family protein [Maribacter sp. PR1]MEE1977736.1 bile acid:sodium symporter family protein [Maribacter cobaltidurans]